MSESYWLLVCFCVLCGAGLLVRALADGGALDALGHVLFLFGLCGIWHMNGTLRERTRWLKKQLGA